MVDSIDEVKSELVDITKLLSRSSNEAFKFKNELLGMNEFVEGKNYQIISRFLSGTGAWKILNKAKASVLTLMQIMNASERAAERDAKRFERMAKASREMTELKKLNSALEQNNIDAIKEALPYYQEMAKAYGGEANLIEYLKKNTQRQMDIQEGLLGGKSKKRFGFETLKDVAERKRHREILEGGKYNTLLVSAGLGLNLKELMKIAKSSNASAAHEAALLDWNTKTAERREELGGMTDLVKMPATLDDFTHMYSTERLKEVPKYSSDEIEGILANEFGNAPKASKQELSKLDKMLGYLAETSKVYKITGALKQGGVRIQRMAFRNLSSISFKEMRQEAKEGAKQTLSFMKDGEKWRERIDKFNKFRKLVQSKIFIFLKTFMYYFTVIILSLFVLHRAFTLLKPTLEGAFEGIKAAFMLGAMVVSAGIESISAGLGLIWEGITSGNIVSVLLGILAVIGGVVMVIGGVLLATIGTLFGALMGALWGIYEKTKEDGKIAIAESITGMMYAVGTVLVLVGAFVTTVMNLPLIMLGLFTIAIAAFADQIMPFANGGTTTSKLQLVGERGPELVSLPRGTRVHSNKESRSMVSNGSGGNTINVHVNGRVGASDAEIRDIANKVAKEINIRMNQTSSTVSMI